MSAVFKANDPNLKRVVAIKMIHEHLSSDPGFVSRFEEEAAAIAQLRHPNIVQVHDFNHEGDVYYMVMEFIPGETLHEQLKRLNQEGRTMPLEDVLKYMINICEASDYAHNRGLIHRDIKPANIMLSVHRQAILMDFGVAKIIGGQQHTATGAVIGTALYMSPEQIKGEQPDLRSDIYNLGVALFEMVSGHPPFEADSAMTLMMMHINDPIPDLQVIDPQVPIELVAVINKALAKSKEERYQTAGEMAAALKAIGAQPGLITPPPPSLDATIVEEPQPLVRAATATAVESTLIEPGVISQETTTKDSHPPSPTIESGTQTGETRPRRIKPLYLFGGVAIILLGLIGIIFAGPYLLNLFSGGDGASLPAAAFTPTQESDQVIALSAQATSSSPTPPNLTTTLSIERTVTPTIGFTPTEPDSAIPDEPQLILWDLSHGPRQSDTGLSYDLDGMYSQLKTLLGEYDIVLVPNQVPLENVDLDRYSTIVIAMPSAIEQNYSSAEAQIIAQFVNRGGSLLILAEAPGFTNRINEVTDYFGIDIGQSLISESALHLEDHPIFDNVAEVSFLFGGGSLNVRNSQAQVIGSQNSMNAVAVIEDLPGTVVVIGDSNLFDNRGLPDNQQLALSLFRWLE
jgi:serine/threonine protein kinase